MVLWSVGQALEHLIMEPLTQGSVFTGKFDDFLTNYSSPERTKRRNLCSGAQGDITSNGGINGVDLYAVLKLHGIYL